MNRWRIAAAAAGLMAALVAVPVQAGEWCLHDPQLKIQTSHGESFTVYVTEGVMGPQHQATLAYAKLGYTTRAVSKSSLLVTVNDFIPSDAYGTFATEMIVSSQPFGAGVVYGSATGMSGSTMKVWFWINPKKVDQ
jgi:hypothetical protein